MNMSSLLFIAVIIVVLFLPNFFLMRKQREAQRRLKEFQASLRPGLRVVTAGGVHGTVAAANAETVELEVAPGVYVTYEATAVIRAADALVGGAAATGAQPDNPEQPGHPETSGHPENSDFPDHSGDPDNRPNS